MNNRGNFNQQSQMYQNQPPQVQNPYQNNYQPNMPNQPAFSNQPPNNMMPYNNVYPNNNFSQNQYAPPPPQNAYPQNNNFNMNVQSPPPGQVASITAGNMPLVPKPFGSTAIPPPPANPPLSQQDEKTDANQKMSLDAVFKATSNATSGSPAPSVSGNDDDDHEMMDTKSSPQMPISDDETTTTKKAKKKSKKKRPAKPISDGDAKRQIAGIIKGWIKLQEIRLNRDDFKVIAKKTTDKMFKHFMTKRKNKPHTTPKTFLNKRRRPKVQTLINKYIENLQKGKLN